SSGLTPSFLATSRCSGLSSARRSGGMFRTASQPATLDRHPSTTISITNLLNDLADGAGAHRMAAFTDREPQAFFHRHRRDQLNDQLHVVSRHYHLGARR